MLEVQATSSNQIWIDKFPLFLNKYTDLTFKNLNNVLDRYKSSLILNSKVHPVESDDFISSNKSWKTILYTMKLEKITSRLNLKIKLKIYLSKWVDKYHENSLP